MRSATRMALAAFALVLWSGSAAAQNDVTFQVNIQPYITSCQFDPATETVVVRGTINDWSGNDNPLADADGDGTYVGTFSLPEGPIEYKFVSTGDLGFEDNTGNRQYTVVPGPQTIPVVDFADGDPVDECGGGGGMDMTYDLRFRVDMNVQIGRGAFDPATERVAVGGSFTGWDAATALPLNESSIDAGVYTGLADDVVLSVPTTDQDKFKFIIIAADESIRDYESPRNPPTQTQGGGNGGDRLLILSGTEPDTNGDGVKEYTYDNDGNPDTEVFYSDADASLFLTEAATVTFNVDLRPAQYRIADAGMLPPGPGSMPATGNTAISGLWINGPAAGESEQDGGPGQGIGDWAGWGEALAAQDGRRLTDNGNGTYSITLNYEPGARRTLVAKFGVGGADNESGFGGDHQLPIEPGTQTYNLAFGCIRQADGTFTDVTDNGNFRAYDEYLIPNNTATPPTCEVVRNGGTVSVENGPTIAGIEIGSAYPNPLRGQGQIDLTLDRAMTVSVRVYDVMGREVATLAEGRQVAAGTLALPISVQALAQGVYVLRVEADGQVATRRMTVTR